MPPPARYSDASKPELVPGIGGLPPGVERQIRTLEYFELSGRATERGLIFAPDGAVLYDQVGKRNQVSFPLRELFNKVATHNHPSGTSFSITDIVEIASWGYLRELRVVGRPSAKPPVTYLYRVRRPEGGWPDAAEVRREFKKHHRLVQMRLARALRKNEISVENAESEHLHLVWTSVAKKLRFEYLREALD
jgi:hypothetical protein